MSSTDVGPGVDDPALHGAMLTAAALRAIESNSDCPLFTDPFAPPLVDAAVARGWQVPPDAEGHPIEVLESYVASRTRWFDEFFIAAGANGVDQAVILAAGLDARAWRLPWLSSSVVYEIDLRTTLDFKTATLAGLGTQCTTARHVPVPADPRSDWRELLQEAGFDVTEPTAWSLEGLLPDWSAEDRMTVMSQAVELSQPCSRMAVEVPSDEGGEVSRWLTDLGWEVAVTEASTVMDRYGRCASPEIADSVPRRAFMDARLPLTPAAGI